MDKAFRSVVVIMALMTVSEYVSAEKAWVTDMLQLGVHAAADTSDSAFTYLKSAETVEVLEQTFYYARVRLDDGREGWVRKTFLVYEPPPRLRVETVEKERDRTASELKSLQEKYNQQKSTINELEKEISSRDGEVRSEQQELEKLRNTNGELNEQLEAYRFSLPVSWVLVGILLSLGAGILASWWWVDSRSRMRHGGFRVY